MRESVNTAFRFGQLVNAAYAVAPTDLGNRAGQIVNAGAPATAYEVITSIYANDLATDMNSDRRSQRISIGLILQAAAAGDVVLALRGTEGVMEWIQDAKFLTLPCPFLRSAGNTEDGFTDMYNPMTTGTTTGSPSVVKAPA